MDANLLTGSLLGLAGAWIGGFGAGVGVQGCVWQEMCVAVWVGAGVGVRARACTTSW